MIEIAAHFVGRVVDRVHLEARRLQPLLWNHHLLHAARGRQFAGGSLLIALHAQEAEEDDEYDGQDTDKIGDRGNVNWDGAGLEGEGGTIGVPARIAHAGGEDQLEEAAEAQQQGKQQEAGLKVAPQRSRDQGDEDK